MTGSAGTSPTFVDRARAAGSAWKAGSPDLPEAARQAGRYGRSRPHDFVLPAEERWSNLLPEAREVARTRFAAAGIRWHGDEDGPNNHTCSSQIQCLNALAPLADQPEGIARIFSQVLPIAEVLPFGASTGSVYERSDHVAFEWQGAANHLGEWTAKTVRGAHATSADAAFRYRALDGQIEMALVEWKYVETYPHRGRLSGTARYHEGRLARYEEVLWGAGGILHTTHQFDYDDLFAEPIYQLTRTQALAARMEQANELGASRVRFVWAAPSANTALVRESLGTRRFERFVMAHGGELPLAWPAALRHPDRFAYLDTSCLLSEDSPMSSAFRERYAALGGLTGPGERR